VRTSSHAFDTKGKHPAGTMEWAKFDAEVLGGNYHNHYPEGPITTVQRTENREYLPILTGVKLPFTSKAALYKNNPLQPTTKALLFGSIPGQKDEPVAWTHQYKKAKVFYTSLGHADDFGNAAFVQLLHNAARWALEMPIQPAPSPRKK
jgi:type 1 glutamine amidotransferase